MPENIKEPSQDVSVDNKEQVATKSKKPNLAPVIIVVALIMLLLMLAQNTEKTVAEITISDFQHQYRNDNIGSIEITGTTITGDFRKANQEEQKKYTVDVNPQFIDACMEDWKSRDIAQPTDDPANDITRGAIILKENKPSWVPALLLNLMPFLLLVILAWFFLFRQIKSAGGSGGILSFGKSRAVIAKDATGITFDDVAGIDEAEEEVSEIVRFLKHPETFKEIGAHIPHGVLLIGRPGTGKTLLARAIAGEANVPFYSISGSDFVEMFVGVGASRVRDLFKRAKENSPCIIFLDEIDAVGRKRGSGVGGGNDEREQTLNAILVEMDGFESDGSIIVIAATNRPDVLDPALRRPGRFDREITVDLPDVEGREQILTVHAKKVKLAADVDLKVIARGTPTFSGAELANLINEAALLNALKGEKTVTMHALEEARDKVRWGRQKSSRVISEKDQMVTAYHEAGHTITNMLLKDADPLHKVTIIPRGMALGATMSLPERDTYGYGKQYLLNQIKMLYGGRIAEEFFCDDISTGASNDIERATNLAQHMVTQWGMSDAIGPIHYSQEDAMASAVSGSYSDNHQTSPSMSEKIDTEIRDILLNCYEAAKKLLDEHRDDVENVAQALLKFESLTAEDIRALMAGTPVEDLKPEPKVKVLKTPEQVQESREVVERSDSVKDDVSLNIRPQES